MKITSIFATLSLALAASFVSTSALAQQVEFKTTEGSFTLELYADKAPKTVANFLQYVKDGFYAGTIFHRVIPSFMIQGGGFTPNMAQKATRAPIALEAAESLAKGLKNDLGTVAMARTNVPDSATAQFFINVKDNAFLNASERSDGYTAFGKVVKGMDVVLKMQSLPTGQSGAHSNVPQKPVVIESAKVVAP
jgi:peptidyl-prolyl cis-trans isomerase A (cyclophilin A)